MRASNSDGNAGQADVYSFKNLDFWKIARSLAVDCVKLARTFPKDDPTRVITRQFVASVTSIRVNIAEGHGRYSKAAHRNHLSIARGSATETEDWLDLLTALEIVDADTGRDLTKRCRQIIAALTSAMRRLDAELLKTKSRIGEARQTYGVYGEQISHSSDSYIDEDAHMFDALMLEGEAK